MHRSLEQAAFIEAHPRSEATVIDAGDLSVTELAVCVCDLMGWNVE